MLKLLQFVLAIIGIICAVLGYPQSNINMMVCSIMLMLGCMFLHSSYQNTAWLMFVITFVFFLFGRILINWMEGENLLSGSMSFIEFNDEQVTFILFQLYAALAGVWIGHWCYILLRKKGDKYQRIERTDEKHLYKLQITSKNIYYITYVFNMLVLMEKVLFVQNTSYISYYTDFARTMPWIIYKIGEMMLPALFFYLSTLPGKKNSRWPIALYLLYALISLGQGARTHFVTSLMIVVFYYSFRQSVNSEERWVTRHEKTAVLLLLPVVFLTMAVYGYTRVGQKMPETTFALIKDFFMNQGGSVAIIGYEKIYGPLLPKGVEYLFGPLMNLIRNNILIQVFFPSAIYVQHTIETALYGNAYGQTITYFVMPYNYLKGVGLGSSYIAEAYHAFGTLGTVIISMLYGWILSITPDAILRHSIKRPYIGAILLMMFYSICNAPRAEAFYFIPFAINVSSLLCYLGIYLISNTYTVRRD